MDELRYKLYHHSKLTIKDLPPKSYTIKGHIQRAYYVTYCQLNCIVEGGRALNPTDYEFKESDGMIVADTYQRLIPDNIVICCNCVKCSTDKWCACRQNGLQCCIFCKCSIGDVCKNPYITEATT